jgi:hypothetical protein
MALRLHGGCTSTMTTAQKITRNTFIAFASTVVHYGSMFRQFRKFCRNDLEFYDSLQRLVGTMVALWVSRGVDTSDYDLIAEDPSIWLTSSEESKPKLKLPPSEESSVVSHS